MSGTGEAAGLRRVGEDRGVASLTRYTGMGREGGRGGLLREQNEMLGCIL